VSPTKAIVSRGEVKLLAVGFVVVIGALIFHNLTYHPSPTPVVTGSSQTPTQPQQPHNVVRRLLAKGVENDLLRAGFDVQVTFIQEDDSRMIIYGKSVNRPFAHNLIARADFRKLLHDGKFTEVTFMDSMTFPDFSQVYEVPRADSDSMSHNLKTSSAPSHVAKAGQDEAAFVIQNCGKPDREFLEKASGATIRHLVYRKFNTELFFFRDAATPQWRLGNAFVPNRDKDMTMEEANRRMPCAKGQLHSLLESK
jgi:hypothetical protein